jgi:hypothetical protein
MSRTKKNPQKKQATSTQALSTPSPSERIKFLQGKHKKMLTQVKRKRTELSNFTHQMREVGMEMLQKSSPLYERAQKADEEIHTLFQEILSKRRLGKRAKKDIEEVYRMLQVTGKISPRPDAFEADELEEESEFPEDDAPEDFDPEEFFGEGRRFYEPEEEDLSKPRPTGDIRKLFLKLAERFHPDKVTDESTRTHYTEVMKEINVAYRNGDFARLLEIHSQSEMEVELSQLDSEEQTCLQLEKEIKALEQQYEQLKVELREVRYTPQGEMVKEYRKAEKAGENLVDLFTEEVEADIALIEEIRDFVNDFRTKKITLAEFLKGPQSLRISIDDELEELLFELFEGGVVMTR